MINCNKCKKDKSDSSFRIHSGRSYRHKICKSCESASRKKYYQTPKGRASKMWSLLNRRANNRSGEHPSYKNISVKMTRDEFISWAIPVLADWYNKTPNVTPTLDRINSHGDYEIGNIRLLTAEQNTNLRPNNHNVHAPKNKSWCGICKQYLNINLFYKDKRRYDGLSVRCKDCHSKKFSKNKYKKSTPKERQFVIDMHKKGLSGYKISKLVNRSMTWVYVLINKSKL